MWNGSTWTQRTAGTFFSPAVSCGSATACTLVGRNSQGGAAIERWDGTSWTAQQPAPVASAQFASVSCASATACTLVGSSQAGSGSSVPLVESWTGGTWTAVPVRHVPDGILNSVSCTTPTVCTAVGQQVLASGGQNPLAVGSG